MSHHPRSCTRAQRRDGFSVVGATPQFGNAGFESHHLHGSSPATATTKKLFWCSIDSGHIEQNMPVRDVASGDPENSASWWSNGGRSRASEAEQTVSASYATSKLAQADDAQTGPITRYPAPSIGGAGQQCPTRAEGAATDGYRNRTTRSARHHQLRSLRR